MLEPWKQLSLLPPPVHTFKSDCQLGTTAIQHVCANIVKMLSNQLPLHREGAVVSRFLYKFDKKFRGDIGYRNFKKVNSSLKKYLALNLLKDVENFSLALPNGDDDYMPTRQMLEYLLVRILTFSKLMLRICICSKTAAIFYLDRVKRGERHWMSLMPFALMSRICSISKILVNQSKSWYTNLYLYLDKLQLKGLAFLPDNYTLPMNIEEWLDLKNIENMGKIEWSQKKTIQFNQLLAEDEDGDTFDKILGYVNKMSNDVQMEPEIEIPEVANKMKPDQQIRVFTGDKVDQGEVVSRESFNRINNKNKEINKGDTEVMFKESIKALSNMNKNKSDRNHYIENVTNAASLRIFISKEEEYRSIDDKQSLTTHLSLMQWHALKKALLKLSNLITNRKIDKKVKKVWKAKCLDYI